MSVHSCENCPRGGVWWYAPGDRYYCEEHVSRGCSCNEICDEHGNSTGVQDTDAQSRLLPCCEYMYKAEGWEL